MCENWCSSKQLTDVVLTLKYLGVVTILLIWRKMNCLNASFNALDTAVVNAYISA